jgi:uncharacterized protein YndB with AHSA1/START domain
MTVNRDAEGNRFVQAEVEVPGTVEEVWEAIATGPGISAWFVPTTLEERAGGVTTSHFGPGMDSHATISVWEPPHRFVVDIPDDLGPDGPPVVTEWSVETRSGDTCVVRVAHRWFTESDEWDEQFIGHTYGWQAFFRILRLYLSRFPGQHGAMLQTMVTTAEPRAAAWGRFCSLLGVAGARVGDAVTAPAGAPPLAGAITWVGQPTLTGDILIALDAPAPGIAHLAAHEMGGQTFLWLRCYLYGDDAPQTVSPLEGKWLAWLQERFPSPAAAAADWGGDDEIAVATDQMAGTPETVTRRTAHDR